MKKPFLLLLASSAGLGFINWIFGYQTAYLIGYGAFTTLAAIIAMTFLWLWVRRSTPLALGMAFGWGGASSIMAWWWLFNLLDRPEIMVGNGWLFVFLSLYFVGAILHLDVIGRSFGLSKFTAFAPVAIALIFSIALSAVL